MKGSYYTNMELKQLFIYYNYFEGFMDINNITNPIHDMNIKPEYFYLVANGDKIYEVRTNDDRRKKMQIGDYIKMYKEPEKEEYLFLEIIDKIEYLSFASLYNSLPKKDVGFEGKTTTEIAQELRRFYTEEQERELGVVAIKVNLIPELSNYRKEFSLKRKLK